MKRRILDLAVAAVILGVVQALAETAVAAVFYRDFLVAPYRFFTVQSYDAFTKLWFLMGDAAPLPSLLSHFLGQGAVAKIALAPQLVAINIAVAVGLALLLAPVAGMLGVGNSPGCDVRAQGDVRSLVRALSVIGVLAVAVHAVVFVVSFQAPEDVGTVKVAKALLRSAMQDGALSALAVLAFSLALSRLVLARQGFRGAVLAAAVVVGSWPLLAGLLASAGALAATGRPTATGAVSTSVPGASASRWR